MRKILLVLVCAVCLILCACTPHSSEVGQQPDTTPSGTEAKPTPGMTLVAPSETPGEYIDVEDPADDPVVVPIITPAPTPESTPAPTPESTPADTPAPSQEPTGGNTPDPTPEATPAPTPTPGATNSSSGIELPFIPAIPK